MHVTVFLTMDCSPSYAAPFPRDVYEIDTRVFTRPEISPLIPFTHVCVSHFRSCLRCSRHRNRVLFRCALRAHAHQGVPHRDITVHLTQTMPRFRAPARRSVSQCVRAATCIVIASHCSSQPRCEPALPLHRMPQVNPLLVVLYPPLTVAFLVVALPFIMFASFINDFQDVSSPAPVPSHRAMSRFPLVSLRRQRSCLDGNPRPLPCDAHPHDELSESLSWFDAERQPAQRLPLRLHLQEDVLRHAQQQHEGVLQGALSRSAGTRDGGVDVVQLRYMIWQE